MVGGGGGEDLDLPGVRIAAALTSAPDSDGFDRGLSRQTKSGREHGGRGEQEEQREQGEEEGGGCGRGSERDSGLRPRAPPRERRYNGIMDLTCSLNKGIDLSVNYGGPFVGASDSLPLGTCSLGVFVNPPPRQPLSCKCVTQLMRVYT